jgi:hypothetical protein
MVRPVHLPSVKLRYLFRPDRLQYRLGYFSLTTKKSTTLANGDYLRYANVKEVARF